VPAQEFEKQIALAFNEYFTNTGTKALAYRNKQWKYSKQTFDVFVDSRRPEHYLAIECKSVDATVTRKLYWKKHFHNKDGISQIDEESAHLKLTGRNGLLAVEARKGVGKPRSCWLVPWRTVFHAFYSGEPGLWIDQITCYPCLIRDKLGYHFTPEIMESLIKEMDGVKKYTPKHAWRNR